MGSREVVRAKWERESTNPTFVSAPWEETLAQFDMPVPPQDIEADGFKGFLPSAWSEEALKEIPDEILGVYDVAVMWNGEKTMTIEKDCLRWNGGRLTPSAVWCLRTDGILDFRLRFTTFCPGQKTVWVKRGSQRGVIESMDACRACDASPEPGRRRVRVRVRVCRVSRYRTNVGYAQLPSRLMPALAPFTMSCSMASSNSAGVAADFKIFRAFGLMNPCSTE